MSNELPANISLLSKNLMFETSLIINPSGFPPAKIPGPLGTPSNVSCSANPCLKSISPLSPCNVIVGVAKELLYNSIFASALFAPS